MSRFPMLELAAIAHKRYPDMALDLAVMCLLSDRRAAGLGALDDRKRRASRRHSPVRNIKERDLLSGHLIYSRTIHIEAHQVLPELDFADYLPGAGAKHMTVTVTTVPERRVAMAMNCYPPETQAERNIVAASLRELRRSTRA